MDAFVEQLRTVAGASAFPDEGSLALEGLEAPVTIRRDRWGVPAIEAASQDDLWFAQGAFTAGERLFQLDLTLRAATGRLSEVFSELTLDEDRFARTIGFRRIASRLVDGWDEPSRRMHSRFRAGARAWMAAMPAPPVEYTLLDLEPSLPEDPADWAAALVYLAWGLSGNWDVELLRSWIAEVAGAEAAALLLPGVTGGDVASFGTGRHGPLLEALPRSRGQGSNDWVLGGSRTAGGAPLLANDPHLLALQPGVWLEAHLAAPGYRARGIALTFTPGVFLGTTAHHAWGATNVSGDVQDLFVEELNAEGTAARFRDVWEPLTIHREEIVVRGEDDPVVLEVRGTRHGPILDRWPIGISRPDLVETPGGQVLSLAWTGATRGIRPSLVLDAAAATSFETFREAALQVGCPGQNFVYADVEGTIGLCVTGDHPIRASGDGGVPVPGWDGEHGWIGWVPRDELPWSRDPADGVLVTANHRVHDDDYPHLLGLDFHTPFRAARIAELVAAGGDDHTVASMAAIQVDTVSLPAARLVPVLAGIEPSTDRQARALRVLETWDLDLRADSPAAALLQVWSTTIARQLLTPVLGAELVRAYLAWREPWHCQVLPGLLEADDLDDELLREALDDAIDLLETETGETEPSGWAWGDLHRLRLSHPLARIPGLEGLFTVADVGYPGDEQTVLQAGMDTREGFEAAVIPSWRAVYDLGDLDRSVGVLPAGISGNPASPHWADQASLFLSGETKSLPFTEEAVAAATVATLSVTPA
jgi:penicillin amidase